MIQEIQDFEWSKENPMVTVSKFHRFHCHFSLGCFSETRGSTALIFSISIFTIKSLQDNTSNAIGKLNLMKI